MSKYGIVIIPGVEVATPQGDIIGLFIYDLPPQGHLNEAALFIRDSGGISYLPHPMRGCSLDEVDLALIDLVEVFNARCSREQNQGAAERFESSAIPRVWASDAHLVGDLGTSSILIESIEPQCIRAALLAGDFEPDRMRYSGAVSRFYSSFTGYRSRHAFSGATKLVIGKVLRRIRRSLTRHSSADRF
jgi:hypothetical protein